MVLEPRTERPEVSWGVRPRRGRPLQRRRIGQPVRTEAQGCEALGEARWYHESEPLSSLALGVRGVF